MGSPASDEVQYHYLGIVRQHGNSKMYDIEIIAADPHVKSVRDVPDRPIVYVNKMVHSKYVGISTLTRYMQLKKFGRNMYVRPQTRARLWYSVNAPLDWIKEVIDLEFDYHIGSKKCLQSKNKKMVEHYVKYRYGRYNRMI